MVVGLLLSPGIWLPPFTGMRVPPSAGLWLPLSPGDLAVPVPRDLAAPVPGDPIACVPVAGCSPAPHLAGAQSPQGLWGAGVGAAPAVPAGSAPRCHCGAAGRNTRSSAEGKPYRNQALGWGGGELPQHGAGGR